MSLQCREEVVAVSECAVRAAGGLLTCVCVKSGQSTKSRAQAAAVGQRLMQFAKLL